MGGGDDGDADVDVLPGELDPDPAVLGESLFGDVEAGHDLHARYDARLEPLGRLYDLVEHAVDPEAHRQLPLEGLDVDVAGPLLDRLEQERVHQADDRGLVGCHVEEVLRLFQLGGQDVVQILGEALDHLLGRVRGQIVDPVDRIEDHLGPRQHGPGREPEKKAQVVQRMDGKRIGHGDQNRVILTLQRKERVLLGKVDGELPDHLGLDIHLGQLIQVGEPGLVAEGPVEVLFGDVAELDEDLADPIPFLGLLLHDLFELFGREAGLLQKDFANAFVRIVHPWPFTLIPFPGRPEIPSAPLRRPTDPAGAEPPYPPPPARGPPH